MSVDTINRAVQLSDYKKKYIYHHHHYYQPTIGFKHLPLKNLKCTFDVRIFINLFLKDPPSENEYQEHFLGVKAAGARG